MNTPHKAAPEQWRMPYGEDRHCISQLHVVAERFARTLAALEQRVKALEGPAAEAAELRAALQQENQRRLAQEASAPAAAPAPDGESEYTDAEWSEIQRFTAPAAAPAPAPAGSLLEAVGRALRESIEFDGDSSWRNEARAAIVVIAEVLRARGQVHTADWLEREADR